MTRSYRVCFQDIAAVKLGPFSNFFAPYGHRHQFQERLVNSLLSARAGFVGRCPRKLDADDLPIGSTLHQDLEAREYCAFAPMERPIFCP